VDVITSQAFANISGKFTTLSFVLHWTLISASTSRYHKIILWNCR